MDAMAGGHAQFECETSEAHVPVRWYKDGSELGNSGQRFSQEDEGRRHRLVVALVSRQDEGTYSCCVGGDAVDFQLRVSGEFLLVAAIERGEGRSGCGRVISFNEWQEGRSDSPWKLGKVLMSLSLLRL